MPLIPMEAWAISDGLGDISSLVTSAVTWIKSYVDAITGNPLILLFVITCFVGLGVGLIRRLIRL